MHIDSDRRYRFGVQPDELWTAITATDRYRGWWPWLRDFDGARFEEGATWRCTVRPPLPYVLRFVLVMDEVDPEQLVRASVSGDIAGTAALQIAAVEDGSEVRLRSSLAPSNRVLRAAALGARPLVRFGHDWVLDTGARQFGHHAV